MLLRFAYQEFINEKELEGLQQSTINHYQLLFSDFLKWSESEEVTAVE